MSSSTKKGKVKFGCKDIARLEVERRGRRSSGTFTDKKENRYGMNRISNCREQRAESRELRAKRKKFQRNDRF